MSFAIAGVSSAQLSAASPSTFGHGDVVREPRVRLFFMGHLQCGSSVLRDPGQPKKKLYLVETLGVTWLYLEWAGPRPSTFEVARGCREIPRHHAPPADDLALFPG